MAFFRRAFLVLVMICLGCSAQSTPAVAPDMALRIERQVRQYYEIPTEVKLDFSPLRPSDFPNYDSLTITLQNGEKKKQYEFLLSKDDKTLIRFTRFDLTKDPYADLMKKINVSGRPTRGNKDAKVVAVNYDDFECPFCSRMHQTLFPGLLKEYGDRVLFIYKDFPLAEIHPWATHAAVDANCLAAQSSDAFWSFADYIHSNQALVNAAKGHENQMVALDGITLQQGQHYNLDATKLQACIKAQNDDIVKASVHEGESLGIDATPTMFINGEKLDGAVPINEVRAALDRALLAAGVQPPPHPAVPPAAGTPSASK